MEYNKFLENTRLDAKKRRFYELYYVWQGKGKYKKSYSVLKITYLPEKCQPFHYYMIRDLQYKCKLYKKRIGDYIN